MLQGFEGATIGQERLNFLSFAQYVERLKAISLYTGAGGLDLGFEAADFGIPQTRERAFLVGARDGADFGVLQATHRPTDNTGNVAQLSLDLGLPSYRTAWDALWDLEDDDSLELQLRGKWADLLPSIPEGQHYLYHTDRGDGLPLFGWRRRFWNFLLKVAKKQPSWTLTAQPGPATGPFHWKSRRLSARELCRIQTIQDSYRPS